MRVRVHNGLVVGKRYREQDSGWLRRWTSEVFSWLPSSVGVALLAGGIAGGDWVTVAVGFVATVGFLPARHPLHRLYVNAFRLAALGVGVAGAAIVFFVGGNWPAGSAFLVVAAFPLGISLSLFGGAEGSRKGTPRAAVALRA